MQVHFFSLKQTSLADPAIREYAICPELPVQVPGGRCTEATEVLRGLIDRVVLHPGERGPEIELVGDIARMVELTLPKNKAAAREGAAASEVFCRSVKLVAGRGFEPLTFRL